VAHRSLLQVKSLRVLNFKRHATPYHIPVYLAQSKGYFRDEGIKVAILEPNDPSDVTEIIGSGKVDMGFKAMIHTLAVCIPAISIGCAVPALIRVYICRCRQRPAISPSPLSDPYWTSLLPA
jgi:NMT1/THI5 like protein